MFRHIASAAAAVLVIGQTAALVAQNAEPTKVFVVNTQDASVSLVDLKAMKEEKRFPVGQRPYGIAVMSDARRLAVGVEDEEAVKFFALPGGEPVGKVPIGKMFNDHLVLTPDGKRLLLANFYSDDVVVIDPSEMKEVGRIEGCSAPHVVKYGPLKRNAYVTCKKITGIAIIDPASQALVKFHQLNVNPRSLTFAPDESKLYFGSFWVNGFFEMETESGKVTKLFSFEPPANNRGDQEVTYHGVEAVLPNILLAANEGRSYVDSVDVITGKLLDRLTSAFRPCCIERIPGTSPVKVLISNLGDGSLQVVEVADNGKLKDLERVKVGAAPKRVAFLPPAAK
ncbi:MAG: hypothetical protein L0211_20360 [Planctomycetaceae bacterium]|nr:hypothetical protein [Planctomycetaceae bacterium]